MSTLSPERKLQIEKKAAIALRETLSAIIGEGDEEMMRDSIEGETGLHEAIEQVVHTMTYDEAFISGLKGAIDEMSQRKLRIETRLKRKRLAIEQAMMIGELPRLELPEATLSLGKNPQALIIVDEEKIPSEYWTPQDPKLDRKAVTDALKEKIEVPGAELDNGGVKLNIRRK